MSNSTEITKEVQFENALKMMSMKTFDALLACGVRSLDGLLCLTVEEMKNAEISELACKEILAIQTAILCENKEFHVLGQLNIAEMSMAIESSRHASDVKQATVSGYGQFTTAIKTLYDRLQGDWEAIRGEMHKAGFDVNSSAYRTAKKRFIDANQVTTEQAAMNTSDLPEKAKEAETVRGNEHQIQRGMSSADIASMLFNASNDLSPSLTNFDDYKNTPIPLKFIKRLPTRARNLLEHKQISTVERLLALSEEDIFGFIGIGRKTVRDIKQLQVKIKFQHNDPQNMATPSESSDSENSTSSHRFMFRFIPRGEEHWPCDPAEWSILSRNLPELFWLTMPQVDDEVRYVTTIRLLKFK